MVKHKILPIIMISFLLINCAVSCSKQETEYEMASGASRVQLTDNDAAADNKTEETSGVLDGSEDVQEHLSGYCFNDYLGVSREAVLEWLNLHAADDYYLGTPYGDEETGFNIETCMRPYGRFAGNYPHMTCTGFVLDVFMQASDKRAEEVHSLTVDMMNLCENYGWLNDVPYYRNEINAYYWGAFIQNYEGGKIETRKFDTIEDLLDSHLAEKGDLIFFMPDSTVYSRNYSGYPCDKYGNVIDCHIGFYWGEDNSGDDLFWHSMPGDLIGYPMEKSRGSFNQISNLTTPSEYSYVLLIPIR